MLATKLRVLRAERGLSLQDAERLTGVTRETLGDLERGRRRPYAQTLAKIAHGYGVGLEELLEEQEEEGKAGTPQDTGRPEDYLDKDEPLLFAQQRADAAEKQLASTAQEYEQLLNKAMEEIDRLKNQVEELKGELLAAYRRSEATKEGRQKIPRRGPRRRRMKKVTRRQARAVKKASRQQKGAPNYPLKNN